MYLKITDFDRKFVTPIANIGKSPKHVIPTNLVLPMNTCIHFVADSDSILGIDSSYCLLRAQTGNVYTYHVQKIRPELGTVHSTNFPINATIRYYHKTHLAIKPLTNLDRSLGTNTSPIVINYALLPKLYKYAKSTLVTYQEWFNIRATMWEMIGQIGTRREHFILYQLPTILPTKAELAQYAINFKPSALSDFHENNSLNLLELWRIVSQDADSPDMAVSEEILDHVNLVFLESGTLSIIRLSELIKWSTEDHTAAATNFYRFLDILFALRTPVQLSNSDFATASELEPSTDKIASLISEQGAAGNLSAAEQKGLLRLAEKYKTIADPHGSGLTLNQMAVTPEELNVEETQVVADASNISDKSMLHSSLQDMDKHYIKDVLHKDVIQNLLMFQPAGVIVKDVKVKTKNTVATKADIYSIQLQPINGSPSPITIQLPVINPDGTFLSGGTTYRLDKQIGEVPFLKTKPNMVALTSYYGKLFVTRNENSVSNYSKWINKQLNARANNSEDRSVTDIIYGITKAGKLNVPRVYTAICETVDSFNSGDYHFTFNYNQIPSLFTEAEIEQLKEHELVPVGWTHNGHFILGMDEDGNILNVVQKAAKHKDAGQIFLLGTIPFLIDPDMGEGPVEFTEFSLLNRRIPIILAFCYLYGLDATLHKLGIKFELQPTNVRLPASNTTYKLKFKNIVYVLNVSNKYHKLLVGGFSAIGKDISRFNGTDFNKQSIYSTLLGSLGITNYHLRELSLLVDMFIEPITMGILTEMGEPTDFYGLLLRANDLLIDDFVPDVSSARYKGYERLAGMMYKEMVNAMRTYRAQGSMTNIGVTMNPNAVWLSVLNDPTVTIVEGSNPIHNLKEHESFTHAGQGGRSAVTMVKDTRGFSQHDLGVVSESTPDSGKVGIRAYLTANPNITSMRGVTRPYDEKTDGPSSLLSTSALLSPGVTHDDAKRLNFISIHHSHGVGCANYDPLPYRTGYEEIIGARVDDLFVVTADSDGVVSEIKPDSLGVTYHDGEHTRLARYKLGVSHGTVAGATIPHNKITDMKVGQRFKKGDALIYNSGFFARSELNPANVIYKHGIVARVALLENSETIEDGCTISTELAEKLVTRGTTLRGLIIDFNMMVHNLVKIGDVVEPDTILCTLESYIGDAVPAKDAKAIKALTRIAGNNPRAKVYGTVTDIEVIYFGKIENMTFSLQEIVSEYDTRRTKNVKRYMLDEAKTGQIDESIRINGKSMVANQIAIKIYIDGNIAMGIGDKLEFVHQLKSTCSKVDPHLITSKDGLEVDALFGYKSVAERIVASPEIMGVMNTVLKELSVQTGKLYLK